MDSSYKLGAFIISSTLNKIFEFIFSYKYLPMEDIRNIVIDMGSYETKLGYADDK